MTDIIDMVDYIIFMVDVDNLKSHIIVTTIATLKPRIMVGVELFL